MTYDYIKRAYGREFKGGQRVQFTECKDSCSTVVRPRVNTYYVKISFDGDKPGRRPHRCHPLSVEHAN